MRAGRDDNIRAQLHLVFNSQPPNAVYPASRSDINTLSQANPVRIQKRDAARQRQTAPAAAKKRTNQTPAKTNSKPVFRQPVGQQLNQPYRKHIPKLVINMKKQSSNHALPPYRISKSCRAFTKTIHQARIVYRTVFSLSVRPFARRDACRTCS